METGERNTQKPLFNMVYIKQKTKKRKKESQESRWKGKQNRKREKQITDFPSFSVLATLFCCQQSCQ